MNDDLELHILVLDARRPARVAANLCCVHCGLPWVRSGMTVIPHQLSSHRGIPWRFRGPGRRRPGGHRQQATRVTRQRRPGPGGPGPRQRPAPAHEPHRPEAGAPAPRRRRLRRPRAGHCCAAGRRSGPPPRGCPGGWPVLPRTRQQATWPRLCGGRRPRTGSTRRGSAMLTRTGRTGMPSTWCASKPAKSCRPDPPATQSRAA